MRCAFKSVKQKRLRHVCCAQIARQAILDFETVTRNLFRSVLSRPCLSFFPLFARLEVASEIQLGDLGERCKLPQREKTTFAATRHVPRAVNTPKIR